MKKIRSLLSLLVLSATASAGGEVTDDSVWTNADGSVSVTVGIEQHSSTNSVGVTFTSGDSTSPEATGTPGENSSAENPTCTESGESTNTAGRFRVKDGKVQKRNSDGTWSNWKRKKKQSTQGSGYETLVVGQPAPKDGTLRPYTGGEIKLLQGELAPASGYFTGGEEVTSLPQ